MMLTLCQQSDEFWSGRRCTNKTETPASLVNWHRDVPVVLQCQLDCKHGKLVTCLETTRVFNVTVFLFSDPGLKEENSLITSATRARNL